MKLKSIGGKWYIKDGERLIILEKGAYAFAYALIMAKIRKKDKTVIKNNYPIRALVPHPKDHIMTKEEKAKILRVKNSIIRGEYF